jgi:hypothetical protein
LFGRFDLRYWSTVGARQLGVVGLGVSLAACDVVWGLSGEPGPCDLTAYDQAIASDLVSNLHVTVAAQAERLVFTNPANQTFEQPLAGGDPIAMSLGVYDPFTLALAPEGELLFHSASLEPPLLQVAERGADGTWRPSTRVPPKGVFAGVPTAADFGDRRVLVRTRFGRPEVQEYVDDGVRWVPVGEPFEVPGPFAPNLTISGLTMVFTAGEPSTGFQVLAANRNSVDDAFGEPSALHRSDVELADAQLAGKRCDTMFVSEGGTLKRLER